MEVLGNLSKKVDVLIIGGGMANTFLFAQGYDVGKSLCERDMAEHAYNILTDAKKLGCEIFFTNEITSSSTKYFNKLMKKSV